MQRRTSGGQSEAGEGERLLGGGAPPTLRRPIDGGGQRVGELAARVRERSPARALGIAGPTVGLRVVTEGEVALRELEESLSMPPAHPADRAGHGEEAWADG